MINKKIRFSTYPSSVRWGILLLCAGWVLHYAFYFKFLAGDEPTRNIYIQVGLGVAICFFVAAINRWARAMCLFFNAGIIILYVLLSAAYFQSGKQDLLVFTLAVAALFGGATYFLLRRECVEFFRRYNPSGEGPQAP